MQAMSGASDKISNTDLELTVRETTLPTEATSVIKVFAASDRVRSNNEHLVLKCSVMLFIRTYTILYQ